MPLRDSGISVLHLSIALETCRTDLRPRVRRSSRYQRICWLATSSSDLLDSRLVSAATDAGWSGQTKPSGVMVRSGVRWVTADSRYRKQRPTVRAVAEMPCECGGRSVSLLDQISLLSDLSQVSHRSPAGPGRCRSASGRACAACVVCYTICTVAPQPLRPRADPRNTH